MTVGETSKTMIHESFCYDDAAHAQFEKLGYVIFDHFLTDTAIQELLGHATRIVGETADCIPDADRQMWLNPHQLGEQWFWDFVNEPKLLDMIERQIGPNILFWSGGGVSKPPHTGMEIKWHQDAPYWNVSGNHAGGVWIALDDVDEENGTMSVLPEWHMKGVLPRGKDEDNDLFNEEIEPSALPENIEELKVSYTLKAGQMATHNVMLPHGSSPNLSDRWRRNIGLRYIAADAVLGDKEYTSFKDGTPYPREFFLVRGEDVNGHGLRRSPFE